MTVVILDTLIVHVTYLLRTVIERTYSVHAQCSLAFRVAAYYYILLHTYYSIQYTGYSIKCTALTDILTIGEKGL